MTASRTHWRRLRLL